MTIRHQMVVDTLALTFEFPNGEEYSFLLEALGSWKDIGKDLYPPPGKIFLTKGVYQTRLTVYGRWSTVKEKRRHLVTMTVRTNHQKTRTFTLELSIGQFIGEEFSKFQGYLAAMLPIANYPKLYATAKVTRLDLAVDISGVHPHEVIAHRAWTKQSRWYMVNNERRTLYLGHATSARRLAVYDRRKKLVRGGNYVGYEKLMRIELRSRHLGCTCAELEHALPNVFAPVVIAKLSRARELADKPWKHAFIDRAEALGAPAAMQMLTEGKRQGIRKLLKKSQAPWWKPDSIWKQLGHALTVFKPADTNLLSPAVSK